MSILTFSSTSLEQFLGAIWDAMSWAIVFILPRIKLSLPLSCCGFFLSRPFIGHKNRRVQNCVVDVKITTIFRTVFLCLSFFYENVFELWDRLWKTLKGDSERESGRYSFWLFRKINWTLWSRDKMILQVWKKGKQKRSLLNSRGRWEMEHFLPYQ